ncbi:unnamed protein product [Spirodela intermedia]|uniref:Uncharacterized protein n=1 Tax=Spirodela intermedia TaxID=51605 RepID=A0A7I8IKZ9_SPIIN|nr:unnamed protein product [Spirodela intermedia]CAA6658544.1 unnamed protein product [Spirodela intermedia]
MVAKKTRQPEVTLRRMELSDVGHLLRLMGDDQVSYNTHWETLNTREDAMEYLKGTILPHPWFRAVCFDGTPVGFLSAKPKLGRNTCRASFQAASSPRCRDWEALVALENAAAQKALGKAGFTKEGEHRKFNAKKEGSGIWQDTVSSV